VSFALKLDTETVERAYPDEALTLPPDTSIRDVFAQLRTRNSGAVTVCEDEAIVGIFTERDALRLLAAGADIDQPISAVMTRNPTTLQKTDSVSKAISLMSSGGYRQLPIVDEENRPVSILKAAGILHYLVEHFPKIIYNLPPEPHHSPQTREGA